jgi:F-type H+-transporting ATPase subunit b
MFLFALAEGSIQLVPDGTIFLHIGLILLMIWILNRTLFRPINRVLEERERKSGRGSGAAGQILGQVDEKVSKYEAALREARSEGYKAQGANKADALAARQTQINAVKEEVSALVAQEKDSVQKQANEAHASLADDARQIAENISSTILKNT